MVKVICPICSEITKYVHDQDFWDCLNCGTEIWPGTRETKNSWCNKNTLIGNGKLGVRQIVKLNKVPERKGSGNRHQNLRFEVFKRDEFKCQYCGRSPKTDGIVLELDHVTPVCDGGRMEISNLVTSCRDCNRGKGSIPLEIKKN